MSYSFQYGVNWAEGEHIWIPGGHIEPEFIRSLTELVTSGYQVGTWKQSNSFPNKVGHIWKSDGYRERAFIRSVRR
jgi:hypothetical protein